MELYSALSQSVEKHSDLTALQWETGSLTYQELLQRVNLIGNQLRDRFGNSRRHIALLAPNTPHFIFGLFGILAAGQVAVPLNPLLKPEELALLLSHGETHLFLYDPILGEQAKAAAEMATTPVETFAIPDFFTQQNLNPKPLDPALQDTELAMILYTSGTTGDPKGVMLSHKNFYSNYKSFSAIFQFTHEDTFICILPLFHSYAMTGILLGALLSGSKISLFPQFAPQKVIECMMREENCILMAVPPMLHMIAHFSTEEVKNHHKIRYAVSGGGPLPVDTAKYFEMKLNKEVLEGYGLTETSPVVAINIPGKNRIGTIGPAMPDVEVQVCDEQGKILGVNEVGELCVRGDLVMMGYYKNPVATEAVFYDGGWLRTGDMATFSEDGYIKIVGRCKDLIVCGGENIYPREVEETLMRHPAVQDAAVLAKPNKLRSEVPYAFVVIRPEAKEQVTESDLRKHCRQHLAEYKVPEGFHFLEQMPKTAKGTVHKEALKREFFGNTVTSQI